MAAQLLTVTEGIKKMNLEEAVILIAILILSKFPTFTVTRVINYISKTFGENVLIYKKKFNFTSLNNDCYYISNKI